MLRTPRTKILKKTIFHSSSSSLPIDNEQPEFFAIPQNVPSSSSNPATSIPTAANSTRHVKASRRRPLLKQTEAEQWAKEKIKTLAGTAQQATEEHDVTMRILLLQEQQEREKLKQQEFATLREKVKLRRENLMLEQLEREIKEKNL